MSRFAVVLPILSLGLSYSQIAEADQTSEQIKRPLPPSAFHSDTPVLGTSTRPNQVVEADRWMQHSTLDFDQLAQEVAKQPRDSGLRAPAQFPSLLRDLNSSLSPEVVNAPNDFWHLEGSPIMADPGWVPIQGGFIGPGISFGIGFPISYLGNVR